MGSDAMTYLPSFIEIGFATQNLVEVDIQMGIWAGR
jgi:hypothetical protein